MRPGAGYVTFGACEIALPARLTPVGTDQLESLVLRARFGEEHRSERPHPGLAATASLLPAPLACLSVGSLLTVLLESPWGRIVGVPLLLGFVILGFLWLAGETAGGVADDSESRRRTPN